MHVIKLWVMQLCYQKRQERCLGKNFKGWITQSHDANDLNQQTLCKFMNLWINKRSNNTPVALEPVDNVCNIHMQMVNDSLFFF